MTSRRAIGLLCSMIVFGCAKDGDRPPGAPPSAKEPASVDAPPAADAKESSPPAPDPCAEIAAKFSDTLRAATGACATAEDCGCYNPVAAEAGCGGVTDRKTADALAELERSFHAADCPWPHQCAAWSCEPTCIEGSCQNAGTPAP